MPDTPESLEQLAAQLAKLKEDQHTTAYSHMVRLEQLQAQIAAPNAALGMLDFRINNLQHELTGFRAEMHTELETVKVQLAEILQLLRGGEQQ